VSKDLQYRPKLLVVSDTAMWKTPNGPVAFEPVVRELESIRNLFSQIVWIGFKYPDKAVPANARKANLSDLKMIMLHRSGGKDLISKIRVLLFQPWYILIVIIQILKAEVIHSRGPSAPAFWSIVFSFLDTKRKYWHKYAGNWDSRNLPISYKIQKWLLVKCKRSFVIFNGFSQFSHIHNFENPCLSNLELSIANNHGDKKIKSILFVGRLSLDKGFDIFLESIKVLFSMNPSITADFQVNVVGDGNPNDFQDILNGSDVPKIYFHGLLSRSDLNKLYEQAYVIVLPSKSEGFPKVIAEAASFGCVPCVTDVSIIGDYIGEDNGILLDNIDPKYIAEKIYNLLTDQVEFEKKSLAARKLVKLFTYERFEERLKSEFLYVTEYQIGTCNK